MASLAAHARAPAPAPARPRARARAGAPARPGGRAPAARGRKLAAASGEGAGGGESASPRTAAADSSDGASGGDGATSEGEARRRAARDDAREALRSSSEYVWRMPSERIEALVGKARGDDDEDDGPSASATINEGKADPTGSLSIGAFNSWASMPVDTQPDFFSARADREAERAAERAAREAERAEIEAAAIAAKEELRRRSDAEYADLKSTLDRGALVCAGGGAAYLFLAYGPDAAASYGVGAALGIAYWGELVREVDALDGQNSPPPEPAPAQAGLPERAAWAVRRLRGAFQRGLLQRRILLPAAVAPVWALWNAVEPGEVHLGLPLLWVGFFAYKIGIVYWAYTEEVAPTWAGAERGGGIDFKRLGYSAWIALGVVAFYLAFGPDSQGP